MIRRAFLFGVAALFSGLRPRKSNAAIPATENGGPIVPNAAVTNFLAECRERRQKIFARWIAGERTTDIAESLGEYPSDVSYAVYCSLESWQDAHRDEIVTHIRQELKRLNQLEEHCRVRLAREPEAWRADWEVMLAKIAAERRKLLGFDNPTRG